MPNWLRNLAISIRAPLSFTPFQNAQQIAPSMQTNIKRFAIENFTIVTQLVSEHGQQLRGDHWGQADVFIVANIVERCLNFGCFDLAKTNYDEPFVRNTA